VEGEKLKFDLGALSELPTGGEPVVSCFKPNCKWRGKVCTMRQSCDEGDCPVRAYYMQQIGDAGELGIYGAAQRFMAEYPVMFRGFHAVVEDGGIKVWYAKNKEAYTIGIPETFEGFPVVCEQMRGV
jgi:hypothetical protein